MLLRLLLIKLIMYMYVLDCIVETGITSAENRYVYANLSSTRDSPIISMRAQVATTLGDGNVSSLLSLIKTAHILSKLVHETLPKRSFLLELISFIYKTYNYTLHTECRFIFFN